MSDRPEREQPDDGDHRFAEVVRAVNELFAARETANPAPRPPPEPWVDKPGALIAAERDVCRGEMVEKLQRLLCGEPQHCRHARCRRRKRCTEMEKIGQLLQEARATLAREQAKWRPPPKPPELPPRPRRRTAGARSA